ncbi:hypothetical protein [Actinopolyspora saharensis]|uniref:Uncharacterized protein n=1 Tax=Actinopolyspora saharensis TaxID=995062 RepID=A0A1H1H342_9ACTN|nr:hypothetical protein [Actinopolyspora saharensis]NHE77859.1 hypothetical protein [Actinopolyspora sp. BKK1]SDR19922.1 hypothetical protein SAMN04489718_4085 [Actinopolyspora saharensis]
MLLTLVVLGVLGAAAIAFARWPLLDSGGGAREWRTTTATVVRSASCGAPDARDLVRVRVGERRLRVPFDGCGHPEGSRLEVRVPARPSGDVHARPPERGGGTGGTGLLVFDSRASTVLCVLAAVSGAGYVLMLAGGSRGPSA